jgi:hypothetical protein
VPDTFITSHHRHHLRRISIGRQSQDDPAANCPIGHRAPSANLHWPSRCCFFDTRGTSLAEVKFGLLQQAASIRTTHDDRRASNVLRIIREKLKREAQWQIAMTTTRSGTLIRRLRADAQPHNWTAGKRLWRRIGRGGAHRSSGMFILCRRCQARHGYSRADGAD